MATPSNINDLAYDFFDNIVVDSVTGGLISLGYIWNTSSLAWEKATGSAGAGNVTVTNFPASYPGAVTQPLPPPTGSIGKGSVDLTAANTWYQVPNSGNVPSVDYNLIVSRETYVGVLRWSYNNNGTPGVANGNRLPRHIGINMEANAVIYCASSSSGDDVNFEYKELT